MSGPSRCQMVLRTTDLEAAHGLVRAALTDAGYRSLRSRRKDEGFEVSAIRGGSGLAVIGQRIPFGRFIGLWTRTAVHARCVRSLDEGDDALHLFVKVVPLMELDDEREIWWITQDPVERLGDSLQARRGLRRVIAAFEARDFTPSPGDGLALPEAAIEPGQPREDVRTRIRRGQRRRTLRIARAAVGIVLALLVYVLVAGVLLPDCARSSRGEEARNEALAVLAKAPDWEENRAYYVGLLDRVHEDAVTRAWVLNRHSEPAFRHAYVEDVLLAMTMRAGADGRHEVAAHLSALSRDH